MRINKTVCCEEKVGEGDVQLGWMEPSSAMVWSGSKGSSQSTNGREKVASRPVARLCMTAC
jgi:hypothetical protein